MFKLITTKATIWRQSGKVHRGNQAANQLRNKRTHRGLVDCGKGLTYEENLNIVDSYTTTESD